MTIHSGHPFADPPGERDPARTLRGRLTDRVTLWTAGSGAADDRVGLTVSSTMVAAGDPAYVLGLIDPDSDLGEALGADGLIVVNLLDWRHRSLADAFAGLAPAPGGPWRLAAWHEDREHPGPPVLQGCSAYAVARVVALEQVGWSLLVKARLEAVRVYKHTDDGSGPEEDEAGLLHHRGRYRRLTPPGGA